MKIINISGPIISNDEKWIYDLFEADATCPSDVINELPENAEPITVVIKSGGGYVIEGNAIYTALKSYKGEVTTLVVEAASAASVIAMAGDIVQITPPGQIMIHNASSFAVGDYHDMDKTREMLQKRNQSIANVYRIKTGMDNEALLELMDKETWMTAQEAKEYGFVDEILFQDQEPENMKITASSGGMLPHDLVKKLQNLKNGNTLDNIQSREESKETKPVSPMARFLF